MERGQALTIGRARVSIFSFLRLEDVPTRADGGVVGSQLVNPGNTAVKQGCERSALCVP